MEYTEVCIIGGGILTLLLGVLHTRFYGFFGWQKDFEGIEPRNARILYTIHVALILLFFCFAIYSLVFSEELSRGTGLGGAISLSYAIFWLWRLIWQVVYLNPIGRTRERRMVFLHYVSVVYFATLFGLYVMPLATRVVT